MEETWKPVVGFEDRYEVSSLGRAWHRENNKRRRENQLNFTK